MNRRELSPSRIKNMEAHSKMLEKAWRMYTNPGSYSLGDVIMAGDLIISSRDSFKLLSGTDSDITDEMYELMMLGLFHWADFNLPLDFKYPKEAKN